MIKPKKPLVPKELLDHLRSVFPDTVPRITDSDREVWVKVGTVDVIRHLQSLYKAQETT